MYLVGPCDMDSNAIAEYISSLDNDYKKNLELDNTALDILEQFAWDEYLSAYNLFSRLNSMDVKIAYKNVNTRVHKLLSSGLIYKVQRYNGSNNKRKAIFYKLTEYGIFQLFLNRINSLLFNQYEVRKSQAMSIICKTFFQNYMNNRLFELFIYPYFESNSLAAIGDYNLWRNLYHYLEYCCSLVEYELRTGEERGHIPHEREIFVWNEILDKENQKQNLLSFLKDKFNLKDIEFNSIKKNNNDTMTVRTRASAPIKLKLDKNRNKVRMTCTDGNNQFKEYEYDLERMGSDIVVVEPMISEENGIVDKAKNELEQLIYEFVCSLVSSITDSDRRKEYLYYKEILSEDKKFKEVVQEIYEKRHKAFERGYNILIGTK